MSAGAITADAAIAAVRGVLGRKRRDAQPITTETELESLGLDSMDMADLFVALEDAGGVELDPASTEGMTTVGDLTRLRPL